MQPREKPIRVSTEVTQICGQRKPTVRPSQSTAKTAVGAGNIKAETPVFRTNTSQMVNSAKNNSKEIRLGRFKLHL